jgi:transcriptional regulator with XRE-family HTH domain
MEKSSISKLPDLGPNSQFAMGLGRAIRERRRARGLTQTELGSPFTKGFVSEVERGRSLPSLRALTFMAERLGVPVSELLEDVKNWLPSVYTPDDEDQHATATTRNG